MVDYATLIVPFVNTLDLETGVDEIDTPARLAAWLAEHDVLDRNTDVRAADVARARVLREALRDVLAANDGTVLREEAVDVLDRQARRSRVSLSFTPVGVDLEPTLTGVDGVLGRMLAAVAVAMTDGSWARYKVCRADECRWAFVDRSRNGARHWCSMRVCGNREKVRAFRARAATS